MDREQRGDSGFTLLEIMIALAIVSGLLVTLIYTLNYNLGIAQRHEFVTVATILGRNKLTELKDTPVSSEGNFPDPNADYRFRAEVKPFTFPGISEISVTVTSGTEELKLSRLVETKQ
ncbi:MAG: type II secretion system protein [Nitrospiraceae bacterium]|nr:type II secretion system protein [Nitrospiraceae bacterium]